jgi:chromosome segregation ATPase
MIAQIENKSVALREQAAPLLIKDSETQAIVAKIETDEAFSVAVKLKMSMEDLVKEINSFFAPERTERHRLWKEKIAEEDAEINPIQEVITALKNGLNEFDRRKREAARKAQEEADRLAKIEADKAKAKIERRIEKAEASGNVDKVEALREEASSIVPISIVQEATSSTVRMDSGTAFTAKTLEVEVVDPMALIREIAAGRFPIGAVDFKMKIVKSHVSSFDLNECPGLSIIRDTKVQTRRK